MHCDVKHIKKMAHDCKRDNAQVQRAKAGQQVLEDKVANVVHILEATRQQAQRHARDARDAQWQVCCCIIAQYVCLHVCRSVLYAHKFAQEQVKDSQNTQMKSTAGGTCVTCTLHRTRTCSPHWQTTVIPAVLKELFSACEAPFEAL